MAIQLWDLRCHWNLFGYSPYKAYKFTGNGHDHLVGVFALAHQASIAFAQPHLRLLTDVLEGLRELFQPELQVATDFGGVAICPGPFDQGASGMGVAGLRDAPPGVGAHP
jgi:hypothetical protein